MKNNFNQMIIWGAVLILSITSCKKLIEIPSNAPGTISQQQVFADSANIMGAVAGVYNNIKAATPGFTPTSSGVQTVCTGLTSDELSITTTNAELQQMYANNILANNSYSTGIWTGAYSVLYQVNDCLAGIATNNKISIGLKEQLTGELKVVRAFFYFQLVNLFGGVPLVTTTDFKTNAVLPRSSVPVIYGQIVKDLNDARGLLKVAYPSAGRARPNLYTASALLAKVYLYQEQWQLAANLSTEVINSNLYGLVSDLSQVFLDGSKEAIWQLPAKGTFYQTIEGSVFVPSAGVIPNYLITPSLLNAFEIGDQRLTKWTTTTVVAGKNYVYPYKYRNNTLNATTTEGYIMLRNGDQILVRAEALAHAGKLDSALADLNQIRSRAGLVKSTATGQTAILSAIQHERQVEMFCEWGNRWFDLNRTHSANMVLGAIKPGWQANAALFPIPFGELQNDPFLQQNPGY